MTRGFVERHYHPEYLPVGTVIPPIPPPIHTKVQKAQAWSTVQGAAAIYWDTIIFDRTAANYPGYGMQLSGGIPTGVFYAPVAGFYQICSRSGMTTTQGLANLQLLLYKNSTLNSSGTQKLANGVTITVDVEDTFFMAVGDSFYTAYSSNIAGGSGLTGVYSACTIDWVGYS